MARTVTVTIADRGLVRRKPHTVKAIICKDLLHQLTPQERVAAVNNWDEVLVKGGTVSLTVPHWSSGLAYADPIRAVWPPVSEAWLHLLNREWREAHAPHATEYTCDFVPTWGYALRPDVSTRHQDYQQFAVLHYKDVCLQLVATLTKS